MTQPKGLSHIYIFVVVIGIVACTPTFTSLTPMATLAKMNIVPLRPRPDYISEVSPEEYTVVPINIFQYRPEQITIVGMGSIEGGFRSTICVDLNLEPLVQKGDTLTDYEGFSDRLFLSVNGEHMQLSDESLFRGVINGKTENDGTQTSWGTGNYLCWITPLDSGRHEVTFQFRQTSGEIQEYSWLFEISE